ncbi:MAG: Transcription initiation protein spt3 [Heterodermia speciosa]|uniref:Transcription initiation protein spt3 n=1 Tax=Heterodermia speciosa TaxID=116794 RepID=A0A8H3HW46_9LECA|nr:MAG: Transcription initiation protein spt3 [Heterodermia speciosa]
MSYSLGMMTSIPEISEEVPSTLEPQSYDTEKLQEKVEWRLLMHGMITQMMFVSGEEAEPSVQTTTIIEEIVREQVVELLKRSTALAQRRGSRSISMYDLFFQIRHDSAKVSRLKQFLSWKDVRKTAKDSDEKGPEVELDDPLAQDPTAGPSVGPAEAGKKGKGGRTRIILPWETQSFFSEQVPEREDDDEEEEEEMTSATMARLKDADERTKGMTREEYVHYSECRQASFTFRKGKRFREWAGFGIVTDSKPNDDIVDILGFLTFEIVQTLTEEALRVKKQEEEVASKKGGGDAGKDKEGQSKKRKREQGLFDPPEEGRTPVSTRHVQEAFRRLQQKPVPGRIRVWMGGPKALHRPEVKIVGFRTIFGGATEAPADYNILQI